MRLQSSLRKTLRRFLLIFLPLLALVSIIAMLFYCLEAKNAKEERFIFETSEVNYLKLQMKTIISDFKMIKSDLAVLISHNEMDKLLESGKLHHKEALADEFLSFCAEKAIYDQVRLLDDNGKEIIRVNYNSGNPYIVPEDQLQFKGNRYYFKDAFKMDEGEMYLSIFDLNIEQGMIEKPLKPMIRFGTIVFDNYGQKRGVAVLNYLGENLINELKLASEGAPGNVMLLNSDGYWLRGVKPEDEWGFMYEDRKNVNFGNDFFNAWQIIAVKESGHFYNKHGLFTFMTVHPFREGWKSTSSSDSTFGKSVRRFQAKDYTWKIVSHVTPDILSARLDSFTISLLSICGTVIALIGCGSWFVAVSGVRRMRTEKHLKERTTEVGKLSYAIEQSPSTVLITDTKGKIEYVNSKFTQLTGYTFEESIGKNPRILKSGKTSYGEYKRLWEIIKSGREWRGEFCNKKKDESLYWESASISSIKDEDGIITNYIAVKEDITDRKKAEEEIKVLNESLEQRVEERTSELTKINKVLKQTNLEHNIVEEELRKSEQKYRGIFDESVVAIYVFNEKKCFIDFNQAGINLLGYTAMELLDMSISDVDADPTVVLPAYQQLLSGKKLVNYEHQLRRKDGTIVTVLNNSRSLINSEGKIVGMQCTLSDITDLKRFEARITSMAQILEESLNEIYIFDAKTLRVLLVNKGARLNLGYSMEELSNFTPLDINPEFIAESFAKLVEPLRVGEKEKLFFTTVHRRKDGSLYDVEVHLQLSIFQSKPAFVAIILDITERKRVENEKNRKSSFLQLLQIATESANKAHEIEDALKPILKGICTNTGWPIGHAYLVSKNVSDLLESSAIWYKEDNRNFNKFYDITQKTEFKSGRGLPGVVMASGKPHWIKNVTKDHNFPRATFADEVGIKAGFAFPVLVEAEVVAVLEFFSTEILDPDDQLLEVMSDVGTQLGRVFERKRMEEELIKIQKLESVGLLAGGIAHDFNNYLQGILGNIQLAKLKMDSNDEIYLNLIESEKSVINAKLLSKQLLTFSKGGEPIKKVFSVADLLKEVSIFSMSGSNIRCRLDLPDNRYLISADNGQINQVINNLFINASHAMPKGGTIKVSTEHFNVGEKDLLPLQEGRYVKISIKDQGTGISHEHLQKIFDPYFTTKETGSGLGLATCFSIIKRHDGYISAESELGVGSIFHIYLPASNEEIHREAVQSEADISRSEPAEEEHVQVKTLLDRKRILLMDDDPVIAKSVSQQLKGLKYEVKTVKNGTEAIAMYKEAMLSNIPFDAVVMDLTIPGGMGGEETIKEMLKIDPDVKAIVASGYSDDPIMNKFSENGFKGVVEKPYTIDELQEVLEEVIMEKEA